MSSDTSFRLMFSVLFVLVVVLRVVFHYQAGTFGENVLPRTERLLTALLRGLLGFPFIIAICIYILFPRWMDWSQLTLPDGLRWLGVALGSVAVGLLFWVHRVLGTNFSPTLTLKQNHHLVAVGPYRRVRHPMYSVMFLMHVAYFLITANWVIGLLGTAVIMMVMLLRTKDEEVLLLGQFGDDYRHYMERTGRFVPRLNTFPKGRRGSQDVRKQM